MHRAWANARGWSGVVVIVAKSGWDLHVPNRVFPPVLVGLPARAAWERKVGWVDLAWGFEPVGGVGDCAAGDGVGIMIGAGEGGADIILDHHGRGLSWPISCSKTSIGL